MMASKSNIQSQQPSVSRSKERVVGSETTQKRHDSEWSAGTTKIIKKNDVVALRKSLEKARAFKESYRNNTDTFVVRSSGPDIAHGKIKFEEGLSAMTGLYEIIKHSAKQALDTKGMTRGLRDYLNHCFMEAPQAGSFIYRANVDLNIGQDSSIGLEQKDFHFRRNINLNFAKNLAMLSRFTREHEKPNYSVLIQNHIDEKLCDSFLSLFSDSAQKLEFDFKWSVYCEADEKMPSRVVFNKDAREKVKSYRKILKVTHPEEFKLLPVYIEKIHVPMDRKDVHKVSYKCKLKTHTLTGTKDIKELSVFDAFREKVGHYVMADVVAIVSDVNPNSNEIVKIDFDLKKYVQPELVGFE